MDLAPLHNGADDGAGRQDPTLDRGTRCQVQLNGSGFLGMFCAYLLVMGIAVLLGNRLFGALSPRYLRIFTGQLFMFF
jgi:hypothetical protein